MNTDQIQQLIEENLENTTAMVEGDGYHFTATVVSPLFEGLMPVKKQQLVYGVLQQYITSGEIHALSLKTLTPAEADAQ